MCDRERKDVTQTAFLKFKPGFFLRILMERQQTGRENESETEQTKTQMTKKIKDMLAPAVSFNIRVFGFRWMRS